MKCFAQLTISQTASFLRYDTVLLVNTFQNGGPDDRFIVRIRSRLLPSSSQMAEVCIIYNGSGSCLAK